MRRRRDHRPLDIGARTEAWIHKVASPSADPARRHIRQMFGLHADGTVPVECPATPGPPTRRRRTPGGSELGRYPPAAAGTVPPAVSRATPGGHGRKGVPHMQIPGRTGAKRVTMDMAVCRGVLRTESKAGDGIMPDMLEAVHWGPASKGVPKQLVVLCHGLGADAYDLIDLAPTWADAVPDALFASVNAPDEHYSGFGRQWWPVSDRRPEVMADGARRAAGILNTFLDAELARLGLPATRVRADGVQPGRDDRAVHRLAASGRAARDPGVLGRADRAGDTRRRAAERSPGAARAWRGGWSGPGPPLPRRRGCVESRRACRSRRCMCPTSAMGSTIPASRWAPRRCGRRLRDVPGLSDGRTRDDVGTCS